METYQKIKKSGSSDGYNIFDYLKTDEQDPNYNRNYFYQFEVYLNNLNFKKVYDMTIVILTLIMFLDNIMFNFEKLKPTMKNWKSEYEGLLMWDITGYENQVELIPSEVVRHKKWIDSLNAVGLRKIAENRTVYKYCDSRLKTFTWHDQKIKEEFYKFCLYMTEFDYFQQLDYV